MSTRRAATLALQTTRPRTSRRAAHLRYNPMSTPSPQTQTIRRTLTVPPKAWDAHIHVTDPDRFPPSTSAGYKVHRATLAQAQANAARLGIPNLVFVQTSTYGTDNTWILECLKEIGPAHGRGVVVIEPGTPAASLPNLRKWHELGVRGVRLNFTSVKRRITPQDLAAVVLEYAALIRPLRTWALHLYMPLELVGVFRPLVDELGVKVVFDHFADPPGIEAPMKRRAGWVELLEVLESANMFVKISAPYRFTADPEFRGLDGLIGQLMEVRDGGAVVFASDWPHTRFEDTDIRPWVTRCLECCNGDESRAMKLFRTNAEDLFDIPG